MRATSNEVAAVSGPWTIVLVEGDRTASTPRHRAARSRFDRLLVAFSPDSSAVSRAWVLDAKASLPIGRGTATEASIGLLDAEVSRNHAIVEREGSRTWWVKDLGSHNGTWVNGERVVDRAGLVHGDVLRVGGSVLLFQTIELDPTAQLVPESSAVWGGSIAMQRLRGEVALIAERPLAVLLLGESGTGKEVIAAEIHRQSRRSGSLVSINCAALPAELVESELFGHAAGAFTGAARRRDGLFVAAEGGTLFLDEVGELPEEVQPKLLRALATGEVRPVGETAARLVDVRVVAATNRDLSVAVESGGFRGDLLARLSGFCLSLPPLRERRDEVLTFATRFLAREGCNAEFDAHAAEALLLYAWPYNVREVEQRMAALAARARGATTITLDLLPPELRGAVEARLVDPPALEGTMPVPPAVSTRARPTADELRAALAHHRGNVSRVAAFYGKSRRQIHRWAEEHGIPLGERGDT